MKVMLHKGNALCQLKWIVGVNKIVTRLRKSHHPRLLGILPDLKLWRLSQNLKMNKYLKAKIFNA